MVQNVFVRILLGATVGPIRKYIKYEAIWTAFDPGTRPFKKTIFGLKTLFFFANHS
jgi:hypothetical protein